MKKIISIILTLGIAFIFGGCMKQESGQLTQKEKLDDFNYMYEVIKDGYPFLKVNKRLNDVDWLENRAEYEQRVKATDSDESFVRVMGGIIEELNNLHTELIKDDDYFSGLKKFHENFGWYDFWNDPVVLKRYNQPSDDIDRDTNKEKSTGMIMYINNEIVLQDIVSNKVAYMHLPQMARCGASIEEDMEVIGEYLKNVKGYDALIIDIRGNSGGSDSYWEQVVSMITPVDIHQTGYMLFREGDVIDNYLAAREDEVEDINILSDLELPNLPEEAMTDFSKVRKLETVIESSDLCNFEGNIYLLVDGKVYSSSESFAIFAKETGFATVIGAVTGGDGGGIDPVMFDLPNSGLLVRMSADMFVTSTGLCNEEFKTTPDYIIEDVSLKNLWGDYSQDNCIQKVLELEGLEFSK